MSSAGEKTYEMLWDCKYCGTKKLLGLTHRHCPSCGAPQDPSLRYFPSDAEKVAVQDHEYAGADKLCPACQNPCSANAKCCGNCGSPLDKGKAVATRSDQVHGEGGSFAGENKEAARADYAAQQGALVPGAKAVVPPPAKGSKTLWIVLAVVGVVFSLLLTMCLWKKEVTLAVTAHSWTREIQIEQFASRNESAWCDSMPPDATSVTRTREVRSTRQVADGQTCTTRRKDKGNGTFAEVQECKPKYRDEPVYDQKCSYFVNRWGVSRSEKASGSSVKDNPVWPTVKLTRTGTGLGAEREGKHLETYTVVFTDAGKSTHECAFDQAKWSSIADGSKWKGKSGVMTNALDCDSLLPAK